jgi:putative endonuclease
VCYLYILKSLKDNKLYVGVTKNLQKRFKQHNLGFVRSTKIRRPFILIYSEKFSTLSEARKKEWEFKCTPWGGKLKKELAEKWSLGPPKADRDGGQQS